MTGRHRRAEVHRPRAALAPLEQVEADVRRDPVQPRAHRGATLEAVAAAPRAKQGLLHGVLGLERRGEHPVAVGGQLAPVGLQLLERRRDGGGLHGGHVRCSTVVSRRPPPQTKTVRLLTASVDARTLDRDGRMGRHPRAGGSGLARAGPRRPDVRAPRRFRHRNRRAPARARSRAAEPDRARSSTTGPRRRPRSSPSPGPPRSRRSTRPTAKASSRSPSTTSAREALVVGAALDSPAREVAAERGIEVFELHVDPAEPAGVFTPRRPRRRLPPAALEPEPDDVALLLHTSGTTSRPKLVPLTHGTALPPRRGTSPRRSGSSRPTAAST